MTDALFPEFPPELQGLAEDVRVMITQALENIYIASHATAYSSVVTVLTAAGLTNAAAFVEEGRQLVMSSLAEEIVRRRG